MNLIIFGPPGAGKGSYAYRLAEKLDVAVISTGNVFREEVKQKTALGNKVESFLRNGELVPNEIVIEVLKERIDKHQNKIGFILDGYPRTIEQAMTLEDRVKIDLIIQLIVPEWIVVERLSNRRVCKKCGANYSTKFLKPKNEGVCDTCGSELFQRNDDKPELISERLKVYEEQTRPILDYYEGKVSLLKIECVNPELPPEVTVKKILQELKKYKFFKESLKTQTKSYR
jgi:adenylate kinase